MLLMTLYSPVFHSWKCREGGPIAEQTKPTELLPNRVANDVYIRSTKNTVKIQLKLQYKIIKYSSYCEFQ